MLVPRRHAGTHGAWGARRQPDDSPGIPGCQTVRTSVRQEMAVAGAAGVGRGDGCDGRADSPRRQPVAPAPHVAATSPAPLGPARPLPPVAVARRVFVSATRDGFPLHRTPGEPYAAARGARPPDPVVAGHLPARPGGEVGEGRLADTPGPRSAPGACNRASTRPSGRARRLARAEQHCRGRSSAAADRSRAGAAPGPEPRRSRARPTRAAAADVPSSRSTLVLPGYPAELRGDLRSRCGQHAPGWVGVPGRPRVCRSSRIRDGNGGSARRHRADA